MAREAGFDFYESMHVWTTPTENMPYPEGVYTENLERFAALVAAANKPETAIAEAYRCGYEAGAIAARDACITLCAEHWRNGGNAMECADAIRAREK